MCFCAAMFHRGLLTALLFISAVRSDVDPATLTIKERQAVALLKALETGDPHGFDSINPNEYIQHNLDVPDGFAGIQELQKAGVGTTMVHTLRVFEDGDFVFAHTNYSFAGVPTVGFDVWRFENDLIVEHWDNLQPKPAGPNPAGHTMLDGPTEATDLDKTQFNKALVSSYSNTLVMPPWNSGAVAVNYIQHNPLLGDGIAGLIQGLTELAKNGTAVHYTSIFKVLAKGDFVLVMQLGTFGPTQVAFYDLYRVADGMIAEHWDTIQPIPSRSQWQSSYGKF